MTLLPRPEGVTVSREICNGMSTPLKMGLPRLNLKVSDITRAKDGCKRLHTLSMTSKGQTVRDARQILLPTKGQGLGSLKKIGDKVKAQ